MKTLKIAIIGNGGICKVCHAPAYEKFDDVEVIALCDIKPEKSEEIKKQFNFEKAKIYTDYKDVLNIEELDAIDICTPNYLHSIIAVEAFEKGLHVFCEKPDAVSVEAVTAMKDAALKANKLLMVMRNNRYWNTSQFLKKYIENGNMGNIYAGRCGWQRTRGIPGRGGWFTTKEQSGGGPLIDLGVHMLDLSIWLMGNPTPVAVSGSTYSVFANKETQSDSVHSVFGEENKDGTFDVEDLAMGFIKFDNGACLQLEFSWASNVEKEDCFVELRGSEAGSSWHINSNTFVLSKEEGGVFSKFQPAVSNSGNLCHERNIRHFIDCITKGDKPNFEPQQGIDMIKILTAIYKSAETGREVIL